MPQRNGVLAGLFALGLEPNDRVGPYVIEGSLGRRGRGEVYLAHDKRQRREVALKLVRRDREGPSEADGWST